MEQEKNYKRLCWIMGIIIALLLAGLFISLLWLKNTKPARLGIQGFFQAVAEEGKVPTHRANFDPDNNSYYIAYCKNNEVISEGTYEKKNDNLYVLTDAQGERQLITLLHNKFYYYDKKMDKVVEFVTDGSGVPTYIMWENGKGQGCAAGTRQSF